MATGIFKLRDQLLGLVQKAWSGRVPTTYSGELSTLGLLTTSSSLLQYTNASPSTAAFTIEAWIYVTQYPSVTNNYNYPAIITKGNIYMNFGVNNTGKLILFQYTPTAYTYASSATIPLNTWTYVAVTVGSSTVTLYINGASTATGTWYGLDTGSSGTPCYIGLAGATTASQYWSGAISNLRVSNIVRSITTPSAPFTSDANTQLLTLQSPTIFDASSNGYAITNQSVSPSNINPFNIPNVATPAVEYLVVAGGGGGDGNPTSGGGGAGGLLQGIIPITTGSPITVTVGAGGTGTNSGNPGNPGANSVFGIITAIGGGGGSQSAPNPGGSGGSGGGGGAAVYAPGGQGILGQGNAGGAGGTSGTYPSGGGGGAGTVGLNAVSTFGGNGGAGIASSISGTVTTYAGGGGGGVYSGGTAGGTGGVGGGGNGGTYTTGSNATANTGGGGGGCGSGASGSGGSGIAIISYPDTYNAPTAVTGTYTASTSGSGSVYLNGSSSVQYSYLASRDNITGNFTVEGWVYPTTSSTFKYVMGTGGSGGAGGWLIFYNSNNTVTFQWPGTGGSINATTTTTLTVNTWTHIAVVVNGSTATVYLNGVSSATANLTTGFSNSTSYGLGMGSSGLYPTNPFTGYITNVRIMNGTALYTSNFTPSTAPLTAISGTSFLYSTVSPSVGTDSSTNSATPVSYTSTPTWNQLSPFATGLGYKNRVYTWTASGTVTF